MHAYALLLCARRLLRYLNTSSRNVSFAFDMVTHANALLFHFYLLFGIIWGPHGVLFVVDSVSEGRKYSG